jgi:hypothetical protein
MYLISSVGPDQFYIEDSLSIQQFCEAFMCLKNSPSLLIWELMNENPREPTPAYLKIMDLGRRIDPHRKFCHPGANYKELDFICPHYLPGLFSEDKRDNRPFLPTEYVHVASYELDKLKYDPGIHDLWGYSLKRGWDVLKKNPWVAGCIAFAWRDPYIRDRSGKIVPAIHREARWGVVDECFRIKPEYHHLFKVYSPVKVSTEPIILDDENSPEITIENLYDFLNISVLKTNWKILQDERVVAQGQWHLDIEAGTKKKIEVPLPPAHKDSYILQISFWDSEDRLVQRVMIPYVWNNLNKPANEVKIKGKLEVLEDNKLVIVKWENGEYCFDKSIGILQVVKVGEEEIQLRGPELNMKIPLPNPGSTFRKKTCIENWTRRVFTGKLDSFKIEEDINNSEVRIETVHQYKTGLLKKVFAVRPNGEIQITCTLPPNGYGISFMFPVTARVIPEEMEDQNRRKSFTDCLSWRRCGLWSWFPNNHLARNMGISNCLNHHDPQNKAMKINTSFLAVGPKDKSLNLVVRDPEAKIHVKCDNWYNELEIFIQGRLEDEYDYFNRVNPLKAMPHAISEDQRTYSFIFQFIDKDGLIEMEQQELNLYHTLIERSKFWRKNVDDLSVDYKIKTVKELLLEFTELNMIID